MLSPTQRARGFTLLEAIVALTVFSTSALALYAWQASSLAALRRAESAQQRTALTLIGLDFARSLNPMTKPTGERTLGNYHIRWRSEPAVPPRQGKGPIGEPSLYQIGLYRLDLEVADERGRSATLQVLQPGFKQVHRFEDL